MREAAEILDKQKENEVTVPINHTPTNFVLIYVPSQPFFEEYITVVG